ncbi:TPA: branched-chain amino acid ABC transporter permease [Streptococcus pneumoniae]
MKENLKVNILWLLLLLAGYSLISVLVSVGVLNLFYVQILQQIGINIILAVGLNLIVGFSGQFSLGHAGFMAIGAYAAAIIGSKLPTYGAFFGAMLVGALLVGALLSGAVALLVGIPTLRLKGDYLAVATLGVSEIIRIFIINGGSLTNGAAGILGIPNFTTWQMVYFFVVITTIATLNFLRSPIGRSTLSVREDEIAAESVGVNTTKIKIIAFVFGAITASIAGSLQAGFIGSVVPKDYTFINSINVLIIVVFGGLGSITGAIVSAIVLGILNMLLQDVASVRMIIYALALVLVMIFRPGGLLGTWELSLSRFFKKSKKEEQN